MSTPNGVKELTLATVAAVTVYSARGTRQGTAFCVSRDLFVTAAHVVSADFKNAQDSLRVVVDLPGAGPVEVEKVPEESYAEQDTPQSDFALLRLRSQEGLPPTICAFLDGQVKPDDSLFIFGHPIGEFRGGKSVTTTYVSESHYAGSVHLGVVGTMQGAPVSPGFSGSPVLNLRTGGVCGMVLLGGDGTAVSHMIHAAAIVRAVDRLAPQQATALRSHRAWLDSLSDDQITALDRCHPGPRMRAYLTHVRTAAEQHPYVGILADIEPPRLSVVYHELCGMRTEDSAFRPKLAITHLLRTQEPAVIVRGRPGAGKSALLNMVAITAADEWLGGETGSCVPVRVTAAALADQPCLTEAMAECLRLEGTGGRFPAAFFEEPPVAHIPWLVLVDGLDEISRVERQIVLQRIAEAGDSRYRFAVATRPLADNELAFSRTLRADAVDLLRLELSQLTSLAEAWFIQLGVPEPHERAIRFTGDISKAGLRDIAATPLMATMLCQLSAMSPSKALPQSRYELYESFIRLLVDRGRPRPVDDELRPLARELVYEVTKERATCLVESLYRDRMIMVRRLAAARCEGDRTPSVALVARWTRRRCPSDIAPGTWERVVREVLMRLGPLAEHRGDFRFIHRSIAEHLAVEHRTRTGAHETREFFRLFGPGGRLRPGSRSFDPRADASLNRFFVALFVQRGRTALEQALHRLAAKGGSVGCEFIACAVADLVPIGSHVVELACGHLSDEFENPSTLTSQFRHQGIGHLDSAYALAQMHDSRGVAGLKKIALNHQLGSVAIEYLGSLAGAESADALYELADSTALVGRLRVKSATHLLLLRDDRALGTLAKLASNATLWTDQHIAAFNALSTDGDRALEHIAHVSLKGASFQVRLQAACWLGGAGDPRAASHLALLALAPGRATGERKSAVAAIAALGDPRAIEALADHVADERLGEKQRALAAAIVTQFGGRARDVLLALQPRLAPTSPIRFEVARQLLAAEDPRALDLFTDLARDAQLSSGRRLEAARELERNGDHRATDLLKRVCDAEDCTVEVRYQTALLLLSRDPHTGQRLLGDVALDERADPFLRKTARTQLVYACGEPGIRLLASLDLADCSDEIQNWRRATIGRVFLAPAPAPAVGADVDESTARSARAALSVRRQIPSGAPRTTASFDEPAAMRPYFLHAVAE